EHYLAPFLSNDSLGNGASLHIRQECKVVITCSNQRIIPLLLNSEATKLEPIELEAIAPTEICNCIQSCPSSNVEASTITQTVIA
ncbi:MAG: hypothetical protein AAFU84_22135, partial [Cyanobacteria bacterium J06633_23]